jgi:hypothetical protein
VAGRRRLRFVSRTSGASEDGASYYLAAKNLSDGDVEVVTSIEVRSSPPSLIAEPPNVATSPSDAALVPGQPNHQ